MMGVSRYEEKKETKKGATAEGNVLYSGTTPSWKLAEYVLFDYEYDVHIRLKCKTTFVEICYASLMVSDNFRS